MLMSVMILLITTPSHYCIDCTKPFAFLNFTDFSNLDQRISTQIYYNDDTWTQRIVTKLNLTLNKLPCSPPRQFISCLYTFSGDGHEYYYTGFYCFQPFTYIFDNKYAVDLNDNSTFFNFFRASKRLETRLMIEQLLKDCGHEASYKRYRQDFMYTKFDFKMTCRVSDYNGLYNETRPEVLINFLKDDINECFTLINGTPVVQSSQMTDAKTKRLSYGEMRGKPVITKCKPANGRCSSKLLLIVNNLQTFKEKRLSMLSVLTVGCESLHDDETLWRLSGYQYNENNFSYSWIISRTSASVYSSQLTSKLWQYPIKFAQDYYPQLCQRYELTTNYECNSTSPWHAHWSLKPGVFWNSANVTNRILNAVADSTMLNSYCSVTLTLKHNFDIRNHTFTVENGKIPELSQNSYRYELDPFIHCLLAVTETEEAEITQNMHLILQCSYLNTFNNNRKFAKKTFDYGVELLENLTNTRRKCKNIDFDVKIYATDTDEVLIIEIPETIKIVTCPTMSLNQKHICAYVINQLKSDDSTNQQDGNDDIDYRISVKCFDSNREGQQACDIELWPSGYERYIEKYRYCDEDALKQAFIQKYRSNYTTTSMPTATHRPMPENCIYMLLGAISSLLISTVMALLHQMVIDSCSRMRRFKVPIRTPALTHLPPNKPPLKRFKRQLTARMPLSEPPTLRFIEREATIRQLYYPDDNLDQFNIEANDEQTINLDDDNDDGAQT